MRQATFAGRTGRRSPSDLKVVLPDLHQARGIDPLAGGVLPLLAEHRVDEGLQQRRVGAVVVAEGGAELVAQSPQDFHGEYRLDR